MANGEVDPFMARLTDEWYGGGPGIEMLVGMIGSGKSTYAAARAKTGAVIVSHDGLARAMRPGCEYDDTVDRIAREVEGAVVTHATAAGCRVVIDRTNLTQNARHRWERWAKELGIPIVAVVFEFTDPAEHARRRFEADPRGMELWQWVRVATDHATQARRSPPPRPGDGCGHVFEYRHGDPVVDPLAALGVK